MASEVRSLPHLLVLPRNYRSIVQIALRFISFSANFTVLFLVASAISSSLSGPVLVMVLEKVNAIADWRAMIGPTDARKAKVTHPNSIRAMCGLDLERNCVHGSDSSESATREIYFFFKETSPGVFSKHDEL